MLRSADEDDYLEVFNAVSQLHDKWSELCCALGLPLSQISAIRKDHAGNTVESLREGISQWLQGNYNIDKHGPPTWRKVVTAVDNPIGGNNHDLAIKISLKHKGILCSTSCITYDIIIDVPPVAIPGQF